MSLFKGAWMKRILEDFDDAIKNLKINKGRTVLSLSGIMIGIACVISITTLGASLKKSVATMFDSMNTNLIIGQPYNVRSDFKMDDRYKQHILDNVSNIHGIYIANILQANAGVKNISLNWQDIQGIDYGWLEAEGIKLAYGKDMDVSAYIQGQHQIIIGDYIAQTLFPEGNAVGKTLWLYFQGNSVYDRMIPKAFKVVGVLENTDVLIGQTRLFYLIPRSVVFNEGLQPLYAMADIVTEGKEYISSVKENLKEITDQYTGRSESFRFYTLEEIIEQSITTVNIVALVLGAIAALSLLVGGVGIMNIMIVTVAERTQEIGIRKALGATKKNILLQFLAEAVTLTITGAILGCIFGLGIAVILVEVIEAKGTGDFFFVPDIKGMIIAVAVSVFIGLFFGLYPAKQAAKLDPVIALQET